MKLPLLPLNEMMVPAPTMVSTTISQSGQTPALEMDPTSQGGCTVCA